MLQIQQVYVKRYITVLSGAVRNIAAQLKMMLDELCDSSMSMLIGTLFYIGCFLGMIIGRLRIQFKRENINFTIKNQETQHFPREPKI